MSKTRPSRATSKIVSVPGTRASKRLCADRSTAKIARDRPSCVAVNQISSPCGDHARPSALMNVSVSFVTVPFRSMTLIVPPSSCGMGWSRNAMRSPLGEIRGSPIQPGRLVEHFADRKLELIEAALLANDGEIGAVRRPVRPVHLIEDFAGRATCKRHSRQRAELLKRLRSGCEAVQPSHRSKRLPSAGIRIFPEKRIRGCRSAWNKCPRDFRPMRR